MTAAEELKSWRELGARMQPVIGAQLFHAGESGEQVNELISIQHTLADLLRSPANNASEPTNE